MAQVRKQPAQPGVLRVGEVPGELRQPTPIGGLAVSGDGRYVVTTDGRGLVRLFDTGTGTCEERKPPLKVNTLHESTQVAISADGTTIAVLYKSVDLIWIMATAAFAATPGRTVPHNYSNGLAVSPDGATVAVWTLWSLTLIDAAAGTQRRMEFGGGDGTEGVGFSPGAGLLAAVCRDRRLRLMDAATGALCGESEELPDDLSSPDVAVRPDGTVLVASRGTPGLLEWGGGSATVRRQPVEVPDLFADRWEPRLLPAAGLLAVRLLGDRLALLDLDSGRVRRELPDTARVLAASADGGTLAVSCGVVVDLYDGASLDRRSVVSGLASTVDAVAFEPDGGAVWTADRTSAQRWTVPDGKPDRTVQLFNGGSNRLSGDARTLLHFRRGSAEQTSDLVRLPAGDCHRLAAVFGRLPAVSPDGGLVYGGSDATTHGMLLLNAVTGLPVAGLDVDGHRPPFCAPAFSPSGRLLADSGGTGIRIWDVASGRGVARFASPGKRPWTLDVSTDEELLAFGCDGRQVHVVSLPSGRPLHVLNGHTRRPISAVAFAPDSTLLASSDGHGTRLWNARTGEPVAVARVGAQALAFSADGRYLAAGGHGLAWIIDVTRLQPAAR